MTSEEFPTSLQRALCESFAVRVDGDDRWAIRSPMIFDDGDALPVFAVRDGAKWYLTDDGMSVSHLFFDEFQFTEARFGRIAQLVSRHSAELGDAHQIRMVLDGPPSPVDIGDFLQLVAQVQGVALTSQSDRDQTRYASTIRTRIEQLLTTPNYDENWSPPELRERTRANYRADLRVSTASSADLVVFAASTSDKANVSALTVGQFGKVRTDLVPVLAYHPDKVASEAIYRFQDEVGDSGSVVPTQPGEYRALVGELKNRGVAISDA